MNAGRPGTEPYLCVHDADAAKDHELEGDLVVVTWQYNRLASHVFRLHFFFFHVLLCDLSRCQYHVVLAKYVYSAPAHFKLLFC
jgi:hypothetical protein